MGICESNMGHSDTGNMEIVPVANYKQVCITIDSYTKGLKTRLKNVMLQYGLGGQIQKKVYESGEGIKNNPIHTEVIAGGPEGDLKDLVEIIKEVIEPIVDFNVKEYLAPELPVENRKHVAILKTDSKIANRRPSDAGDDSGLESGIINTAVKATSRMKNHAKKVLAIMSDIPVLSDYTNDLEEKWSLLVKEMPKELISTKSLFHPFSVHSFSIYPEDGPSVLKACLEWKLGIPYEYIELYTTSGIPLTDADTLLKEKQCIYVDSRITEKFFEGEKEQMLKNEMMKITQEPFIYHKMALHGMNMESLVGMFKNMNEERAQAIIKEDLSVSGIIAVRMFLLIKNMKL